MKELEMIKAFAELEGIDLTEHRGHWLHKNDQGHMFVDDVTMTWYNPITDLALNCAARDKYKAEVAYWLNSVVVDEEGHSGQASFEEQSVSKAVIECILKSKGLWK